MTTLLRIAERVLNRPLLVHPDKVPFILAVLEGRIPVGSSVRDLCDASERISELPEEAQAVLRGPRRDASRFVGDSVEVDPLTGKTTKVLPYKRTKDGTAILSVTGSLINRGAFVGSSSGETSYEGIKFQAASIAADSKVSNVILDIESPGGEAVGAFEAAQAIKELSAIKPVTAVVNGMAASAAYALASGASKIVTTPTGVVGSIGVVLLHADYSRALDKAGITPTLIFAGAHKVDGNPFEPLPEAVRADMQREVMQFYDLFIQTVANGRKQMSSQAIRGTEARVFIGQEAVDIGLADEVGTFESVLAEISARSTARNLSAFNLKGSLMTNKNEGAPAAENTGITLEAHTAAVEAAAAQGKTAGIAEGIAQGKKAAHDRFAAILADEKIKGKEKTALDLAMKSPDMSAADVVAFVAALPAGTTSLDARMARQGVDLALGNLMETPRTDGAWAKVISRLPASKKAAA